MNPQIMIVSVAAAVSVAFIGFLAYRLGTRCNDHDFMNSLPQEDNSSLEEDLKDALAFVPLDEVQQIIERYMRYDSQIGDTISFINDQKRFILRQLRNMPQVIWFIEFLKQNGLDVDEWQQKLLTFWKTTPRFTRNDPSLANGGLTVMINNILKTIPLDELHELLRQKVKYSASFRRFLQMLRSKEFADLCNAIEEDDVMHHHLFWAKESGLEITFAIELLKDLHVYLTQTLITPC
ncbi:protein G12 [Calliopsis andreniformis]|uniref:protein G12 n=1 Tax=Calliopsis andreniformis TaxID=337506 RepID=UPI003FCE4809